jgi:hypothetical protein
MTRRRRIVAWAVGVIVGLVALYYLFEWAGLLLDSGGTLT